MSLSREMLRASGVVMKRACRSRMCSSSAPESIVRLALHESPRISTYIPHALFAILLGSCPQKLSLADDKSVDEFLSYAHSGDAANVKKLLSKGVGVNEENADGWSAVRLAAMEGNAEVVEVLLGKGADVESQGTGEGTPLMLAALEGHTKIVVMLVEKAGARVDARHSKSKATALAMAAANGHNETVEALLLLGADLSTRDSNGKQPLDLAATYKHKVVVALLLQHGAEMEAGNTYNGMRWGSFESGVKK